MIEQKRVDKKSVDKSCTVVVAVAYRTVIGLSVFYYLGRSGWGSMPQVGYD